VEEGVEIYEAVKKNFETIAMARVSTSAARPAAWDF